MYFKILTVFLLLISGPLMASDEKIIYGYVEKAILVDKNLTLSAKLDTGAKSASLSAIDIQEIEVNGKPFLEFKVPVKDQLVKFQAPYMGKVNIKARVGEQFTVLNHTIKRPIVLMTIKIGELTRTIAVNLTNRNRFNYPLLLGRDAIIAFNGLIDPKQAFLLRKSANLNYEIK